MGERNIGLGCQGVPTKGTGDTGKQWWVSCTANSLYKLYTHKLSHMAPTHSANRADCRSPSSPSSSISLDRLSSSESSEPSRGKGAWQSGAAAGSPRGWPITCSSEQSCSTGDRGVCGRSGRGGGGGRWRGGDGGGLLTQTTETPYNARKRGRVQRTGGCGAVSFRMSRRYLLRWTR